MAKPSNSNIRRGTIQQLAFPGAQHPQQELDLYPAPQGHPPGYVSTGSSAHLSRTLMYKELTLLFECVTDVNADPDSYRDAIVESNCLQKTSLSNRKATFNLLKRLYTLDAANPTFTAMRFYWEAEPAGRPLICALMAYVRDPAFRLSAKFILPLQEFQVATYQEVQTLLEHNYEDRFSTASYKALAQHIMSSWAQSGHVEGIKNKHRIRPIATPASLAFAVELAQLAGISPEERLVTPYINLLDLNTLRAISLAEDADHRGWLRVRRLGRVASIAVTPRK